MALLLFLPGKRIDREIDCSFLVVSKAIYSEEALVEIALDPEYADGF